MTTLKVTAKGQITLRREVLEHLGVAPGERLVVDKLPGGGVALRAEGRKGALRSLFGSLKPEPGRTLSLEEMEKIAADGWAGRR